MTAIVYEARNLINGKRYVGITMRALQRRVWDHFDGARRGRGGVFGRAIRAFGKDAFWFCTLKKCASITEACSEERRLIALWRPEYNASPGGEPLYQVPNTNVAQLAVFYAGRAAASKRRQKRIICLSDGAVFDSCAAASDHCGVSRSAITMALKGINATAAGRFFAYYTGQTALHDPVAALEAVRREQMRKMFVACPFIGKQKQVICVTDGRRFSSVTSAATAYGITIHRVSRVLRGERRADRGLVFKYVEQEKA